MSQVAIEHIEPTSLAKVSEFLRQEWVTFDRELLGEDSPVRWEKKRLAGCPAQHPCRALSRCCFNRSSSLVNSRQQRGLLGCLANLL